MDVFWLEQRLADVPLNDDWLSVRELERLHTLKFPRRRADWRLGRWTAKQAISNLLGIAALASIEIVAEPSGAPFVVVPNEVTGLTISLSHRSGIGACAVAERGVLGCDVELMEPRGEAFLQDYFTPDELALIGRAGTDRVKAATIVWSAKESALKAVREGLRRDTRSVSVVHIGVGDASTWNPLRVRCDSGEVFDGWWCEADRLVRTLVAAPAPAVPIPLEVVFEALV
jgi:4'-phosphopantetheinyl transferase